MSEVTESRVREIVREEIAERFKPTESQKNALEAFREIASFEIPEREPPASLERSKAYLQAQADRLASRSNLQESASEPERDRQGHRTIQPLTAASSDSSSDL